MVSCRACQLQERRGAAAEGGGGGDPGNHPADHGVRHLPSPAPGPLCVFLPAKLCSGQQPRQQVVRIAWATRVRHQLKGSGVLRRRQLRPAGVCRYGVRCAQHLVRWSLAPCETCARGFYQLCSLHVCTAAWCRCQEEHCSADGHGCHATGRTATPSSSTTRQTSSCGHLPQGWAPALLAVAAHCLASAIACRVS